MRRVSRHLNIKIMKRVITDDTYMGSRAPVQNVSNTQGTCSSYDLQDTAGHLNIITIYAHLLRFHV